jgi:hypothetical protein
MQQKIAFTVTFMGSGETNDLLRCPSDFKILRPVILFVIFLKEVYFEGEVTILCRSRGIKNMWG